MMCVYRDPALKRAVCRCCDAALIPGLTSTVRVKRESHLTLRLTVQTKGLISFSNYSIKGTRASSRLHLSRMPRSAAHPGNAARSAGGAFDRCSRGGRRRQTTRGQRIELGSAH